MYVMECRSNRLPVKLCVCVPYVHLENVQKRKGDPLAKSPHETDPEVYF